MIDNLLANVRTHTPPGTTDIDRVDVARRPRPSIIVADDGPGMQPDDAERVFERFFRADPSRSRQSGGAGLGMAIVAAIVAAHGGTCQRRHGARRRRPASRSSIPPVGATRSGAERRTDR